MNRRLLALSLVALLTLAVPTAGVTVGAVVSNGDDVVDGSDQLVELDPHSGPNGQYVSITNGDLEVEFSRLNDDALTVADEVFTITSTAQETVEVWVTVSDSSVDVYHGDSTSNSFDEQASAVELDPGESVAVGFQIDSRGPAPSAASMTVHVTDPDQSGGSQPGGGGAGGSGGGGSDDGDTGDGDQDETDDNETDMPDDSGANLDFEVTQVRAPSTLAPGETATVVATVENRGDGTGEYTAQLEVDGVIVTQQVMSVPAGENRTVSFEWTFTQPGTYTVSVGDEQAEINVSADESGENESTSGNETTAGNGTLTVVDVQIAETKISPDSETTVIATVRNDGDAKDTFTVTLVVAGVELETRTVTLEPGEQTTLRFVRTFEQEGVYTVAINGMKGGEVTVSTPGVLRSRKLPSSLQTTAAAPAGAIGLLLLVGLRRRW